VGQDCLSTRYGIDAKLVSGLTDLGLSSIANVIASIKLAKYLDLGENDVVLTVATDGADLYKTELELVSARHYPDGFDTIDAAEVFAQFVKAAATDHVLELDRRGRERIFNLGYYTWVEQQGIDVEAFDARRSPAYWDRLMEVVPAWDELIMRFNAAAS
jgi:hypothetical protein